MRGDLSDHRSMLINVSRFTDVQVKIKELVIVWLNQVQSDVRNYSSLSEDQAMEIKSIKFLKQLWDRYKLEDKAGVSWLVIQQQYLHKAIAPIEARAVNQKRSR